MSIHVHIHGRPAIRPVADPAAAEARWRAAEEAERKRDAAVIAEFNRREAAARASADAHTNDFGRPIRFDLNAPAVEANEVGDTRAQAHRLAQEQK